MDAPVALGRNNGRPRPVLGTLASGRRPHPAGCALGLVAALAVAGVLFVRPCLGAIGLQAILTDGTIPRLHLWALVGVLLAVVVLVTLLRRRAPQGVDLNPHLGLAVVAVVQLAVLGGYMLVEVGELRDPLSGSWHSGSLLVSLLVATLAVVVVLHARVARANGLRVVAHD